MKYTKIEAYIMRGVVDRIEGKIAVCEMEGKKMTDIPLSSFTEIPKSGDVFEIENGVASIKREETIRRKESAQELFLRLKKK